MAVNTNAGAIDALANYWITRAAYRRRQEQTELPEFNLPNGASEAVMEWATAAGYTHEVANSISSGFHAGIELATILHSRPLDAEAASARILDDLEILARASSAPTLPQVEV